MKIAEIKAKRRQELIKEKAIKNTKESKVYESIFNAFAKEIDRDELKPALSIIGVYLSESLVMVKLKFPSHKSIILRIEFEDSLFLEPKIKMVFISNETPISPFSLSDILIMAEEEND